MRFPYEGCPDPRRRVRILHRERRWQPTTRCVWDIFCSVSKAVPIAVAASPRARAQLRKLIEEEEAEFVQQLIGNVDFERAQDATDEQLGEDVTAAAAESLTHGLLGARSCDTLTR